MITKTINLYTIDELEEVSKEGYTRAIENEREGNEYHFLGEYLEEYLLELLKEHKDIKYDGESDMKVYYSFPYCHGDGAMFEGYITYTYKGKDYNIKIKQSGRYCHYNSKDFTITDEDGNYIDGQIYEDFDSVYKDICKKLEKEGYSYIESEDSEENIHDNLSINGFMFTIDGLIE